MRSLSRALLGLFAAAMFLGCFGPPIPGPFGGSSSSTYDDSDDVDSGSSSSADCVRWECDYSREGDQGDRSFCVSDDTTGSNSVDTLMENFCNGIGHEPCDWWDCDYTGDDCRGDEDVERCSG